MQFLKNIAALLLAYSYFSAHAGKLEALKMGDFATYTLALSWQAGFCQKMSSSNRQPSECNNPAPKNKADYLTIHGLWPSLPASLEATMQGRDPTKNLKNWFRYGCSTRPLSYALFGSDKKCAAPAMNFSPAFRTELLKAMPGASDATCLDRYEYAKHGVCFEFKHEDYFGAMLSLNKQVKAGKLGQFLADNYGKTVTRDALAQAFAADFGQASLAGLSLACNQSAKGSALAEVQLIIQRNMINAPLSAKSFGSAEGRNGNCVGSILIGTWGS